MGLHGSIRGKRVRTTVPEKAAPCPRDHVNRQFRAERSNMLWVPDFTYVAKSWRSRASHPTQSFVYVAIVIDAYARCIVGWRVSRTSHAGFVLDALEQALHDRRPVGGGLVHHSNRGVCGTSRSSIPNASPKQFSCRLSAAQWTGAIKDKAFFAYADS